jgi:F-type H+-transporting ATPase subunit gamma
VANIKEIKTKIRSIKSTQKITRAMEMVAASKMRRAQDKMFASRPYAKCMRKVITHLTQRQLDCEHPYLQEREPKRVGFIIVTTDRGLCGGLNTALFRVALEKMQQWETKQVGIDLCTIGSKAEVFFRRHLANIVAGASFLGDRPTAQAVIGPVKILLDAYEAKKLDKIFFIYNEFVNTMSQVPRVEMLLPIVNHQVDKHQNNSDYLYEPAPAVLLDMVLKRYVESLVYQGIVENVACEQAARMVAMKNASDNAGDLINDFQLMYNKARQAAITKEISEIVAGAAAV